MVWVQIIRTCQAHLKRRKLAHVQLESEASGGSCRVVRHHQGHSPNPFIYKVHQKATTPQYQDAVRLALGYHLAHQPYSAMRRVLDTSATRTIIWYVANP